MKPIIVDLALMEAGTRPELITSANQEHALDLPAAITPRGEVASCWELTPEERQWVARGANIYLFVQPFGRPVQPVSMVVGNEAAPAAPPDDTLARVAPTWEPIETAPKDGTQILAWDGYDYEVAHYSVKADEWTVCDDEYHMHPTHWMPLPDPPVEAVRPDAPRAEGDT